MTDPTIDAGIIIRIKIILRGISRVESGNGRSERQKTIPVVMHPDIHPEAIPSPEIFTAAIPPITALRYRAQSDRGTVSESGSAVEYAIPQKMSIRTIVAVAHVI